jgi:hypothetical protein
LLERERTSVCVMDVPGKPLVSIGVFGVVVVSKL